MYFNRNPDTQGQVDQCSENNIYIYIYNVCITEKKIRVQNVFCFLF